MQVLHDILAGILAADGNILLWIQEYLRFEWLTPIMVKITHLGDKGFIWVVIGVVLLFPRKTRRAGILSLLALLSAHLLCNYVLKDYVGRIRPYEVIDGLSCIIGKVGSFSFPSGHTMTAFAAAIVIFKSRPARLGIPVMVLAFLIGFTRLYVGVHYPTDVIFGAIMGTLIGLIFFWIFGDKRYKEKARRKRRRR